MSIIQPKQVDKDRSVLIQETESKIRNLCLSLYKLIERRYQFVFDEIWNNRDGIEPQEIFDSFGQEAYELFVFSSEIQRLLSQVNNEYVPMVPTSDYVINENGTVSIVEDNLDTSEDISGDEIE